MSHRSVVSWKLYCSWHDLKGLNQQVPSKGHQRKKERLLAQISFSRFKPKQMDCITIPKVVFIGQLIDTAQGLYHIPFLSNLVMKQRLSVVSISYFRNPMLLKLNTYFFPLLCIKELNNSGNNGIKGTSILVLSNSLLGQLTNRNSFFNTT